MKKYNCIALTALLASLFSGNLMAAELMVTVENIKQVQGSLYLSVYDKQASFDSNDKAVKRQKITVDKSTIKVSLGDLPAGVYAIKTYQDVNENGKFDFTSAGMPDEPFGSSSQSQEMAPPNFEAAKFNFPKNQQVKIYLLNNLK